MREIILLDYGDEKIEALCDFIINQGCVVDIVSHESHPSFFAIVKIQNMLNLSLYEYRG